MPSGTPSIGRLTLAAAGAPDDLNGHVVVEHALQNRSRTSSQDLGSVGGGIFARSSGSPSAWDAIITPGGPLAVGEPGPPLCLIAGVGAGFYWHASYAPFGAIPAGFLATVKPLPTAAALAYSRSNSASVSIQHFAAVASPSDSMLIVLVHSTSHRWPRSERAVIRKSSPST